MLILLNTFAQSSVITFMKNFVTLLLAISFSTFAFAQAPLAEGSLQLNAGIGITTSAIPLSLGLDYGLMPDITVGGEINFWSYSNRVVFSDYRFRVIGISGNANYHFNTIADLPSEIDVYAGLNLGFYVVSTSFAGGSGSNLGLGAQVGGRYFFSDNLAALIELGGGTYYSTGKIGLTILLD